MAGPQLDEEVRVQVPAVAVARPLELDSLKSASDGSAPETTPPQPRERRRQCAPRRRRRPVRQGERHKRLLRGGGPRGEVTLQRAPFTSSLAPHAARAPRSPAARLAAAA